ncbi:WD40 repeat domain-containing protein [Dolichospermum sp. UHCC 0352]|uniref:WD40 repeat domain-containing protein n=1 Tax=Dolichospermum sp. UHCC 0352 TaxID=2590011 RepID=UPI0014461D82|nr:WD40 repeat domain-containing protein [Dolichospermum sp. UHCC 0352]MTJ24104.1 WD40 repeat domain-containing protein [Dolichospermum sp. UHCC 0352]
MDWITLQQKLQDDFIKRLSLNSKLLNCLTDPHNEFKSYPDEFMVVYAEDLEKIIKYCWDITDKFKKTSQKSVYENYFNNLQGKLGELVVKQYLGNLVTSIDLQIKIGGDGKVDFRLISEPSVGIQVKVRSGNFNYVEWCIDREEINNNSVIVCILIPDKITVHQQKYCLIMAGFIPAFLIKKYGNKVYLQINDLLYIGGLKEYLNSLNSKNNTHKKIEFLPAKQEKSNTSKYWECIYTLINNTSGITSVSISPDGYILASESIELSHKIINIWHLETVKKLYTFTANTKVEFLAFTNKGQTLASSCSDDKTIRLCNTGTVMEFRTLKHYNEWFRYLAITSDGNMIASSGGWNKLGGKSSIKLLQLSTKKELHTLHGHRDYVRSIAFSPDGQLLSSGSDDTTIKIWQVSTGKKVRTLKGHEDWVFSIAFSPDGQLLASGSDDTTIKIWQVSTGQELFTLTGHTKSVNCIAFTPDGQTLVSGSDDKSIKIWRFNN